MQHPETWMLNQEQLDGLLAAVEKSVSMVLRDEDYRGGPLQRQYPPAVIKGMSQAVASDVENHLYNNKLLE